MFLDKKVAITRTWERNEKRLHICLNMPANCNCRNYLMAFSFFSFIVSRKNLLSSSECKVHISAKRSFQHVDEYSHGTFTFHKHFLINI